jgi:hypothetical protein
MSQLFYQLSGGCCEKWADGKKKTFIFERTGHGTRLRTTNQKKFKTIPRSLQTKLRSVNPEKARMNIHLNW